MNTCRICANKERSAIDERLVAGRGVREVAAEFGFSKSSVHRHRTNCLKRLLTKADSSQSRELRRADQLLGKLDKLLKEALSVARRAKRGGDDALLLKALNEARDTVRLMGEFTGAKVEPAPKTQTNYVIVFEGGRPVMKKAEGEIIEARALPSPESIQ
jgi:hypothetical protein